jgi:hypothetical protein
MRSPPGWEPVRTEQLQSACRQTTVKEKIPTIFEGGSGRNRKVQGFEKLLVQAVVGHHEATETSHRYHPTSPPHADWAVSSLRLWLAAGSWNEKEPVCVYISSNVSFGFAFTTDIIVDQVQHHPENNRPVLFGSVMDPPHTGLNFSVWALVYYIFSYVIKQMVAI